MYAFLIYLLLYGAYKTLGAIALLVDLNLFQSFSLMEKLFISNRIYQ